MAKKYTHLRLETFSYKELKKIKNIYELQDNKDYTFSEVILKLIHDRITLKPFKLDHVVGAERDKLM